MKNVLIIGGGFSGCSSAEIISRIPNTKITVIEKGMTLGAGVRTHFNGGHPFTFGPRHFLTTKIEAYDYLKKFLKLRNVNYHKFISYVRQDDNFYNYPLNVKDIEKMPDKKIIKSEIKAAKNVGSSKNLEEFWVRSVGKTLFNKTINEYNKKMWQVDSCKEIDSFKWSPKGYTIKKGKEAAYDDRISMYPTEKNGYNSYFDLIPKIKNVKVKFKSELNSVNFKKKIATINGKKIKFDILINTIAPDTLFNYKFGKLKFIGRDLHTFVLPGKFAFPKNVFFVYFPNTEKFTRLVEYKKFTRHKSNNTLIGMELPSSNGRYYPVPFKKEQIKAQKYFKLFPEWTYSIGRAGTYRYEVDIDDCILQSLEIGEQIKNNNYKGPRVSGDQFQL
ncbi:UDP-galactopyranose mutase [Candidatus Pelagibacter sp.]|nr:UDP-galactopyranose mutase [Candidatus Pelagibacter sp.]